MNEKNNSFVELYAIIEYNTLPYDLNASILGIFNTKEKAEKYKKQHIVGYYIIEKWKVEREIIENQESNILKKIIK